MANKYHINKETGRVNICRATKKGCPLGADTPHFDGKEKAYNYIEKIAKEENYNKQLQTFNKKGKNNQTIVNNDKLLNDLNIIADFSNKNNSETRSALRRVQNEWFNNLTDNELKAVSVYGSPTQHRNINKKLREKTELTDNESELVHNLDSALKKSYDLAKPVKVFRGITLNPEELEEYLNNETVTFNGYTSTTVRRKIAQLFTDNDSINEGEKIKVLFELSTKKCAPIDLGESELLIHRNSKFKIIDVNTSDDLTVIKLLNI